MKKLLTLAAIVLVTSCTRNSEQLQQETQPEVAPSVTSYSFQKVSAGSNQSVKFEIVMNIPSDNVKAFKIYRMPSTNVATIELPKTGLHVTYDHMIGDYPTYGENVWYYFVWEMKGGETIVMNKFQVY